MKIMRKLITVHEAYVIIKYVAMASEAPVRGQPAIRRAG